MGIEYKKAILSSSSAVDELLSNNTDFVVLDNSTEVNTYPLSEIESVLRAPISTRFFRWYLLHENETIKEDITHEVIFGGNIEKTYQQGQTRSTSITLMNPINIWNPSPNKGKLFANSKFKLQIGIRLGNIIYWKNEGIFVCQDPEMNNENANKTVSIQLYDKFALLDGTIMGTTETDYEIPVGTSVWQAVRQLIQQTKDRLGYVYDSQTVIYPPKLANEKLAYTIKKTANSNIGEILTDIADSLSCDIFYNENGNLTFRNNLDDLNYHNRELKWNYSLDGLECIGVSRTDKWSEIKNRIIVKGANVNGMLYKGIAENTSASSAYNIKGSFGIHPEIIEDSLIYSPTLCRQRAQYELKKKAMRNVSINFQSIYIPHLAPNDLVRWSFEDYGYNNDLFIVDSVSIPLDPKELMSVTITNIEEII